VPRRRMSSAWLKRATGVYETTNSTFNERPSNREGGRHLVRAGITIIASSAHWNAANFQMRKLNRSNGPLLIATDLYATCRVHALSLPGLIA